MESNTENIYLDDILRDYEHTAMLHTEQWRAYKDDIDQFERDITEIGQVEDDMPDYVKARYYELQQMLEKMREDAKDLKQHIDLCFEKIHLLKRLQ